MEKPAELFISPHGRISLGHAPLAERAARAGLTVHEANPKLLECLLEAQRAQGLFPTRSPPRGKGSLSRVTPALSRRRPSSSSRTRRASPRRAFTRGSYPCTKRSPSFRRRETRRLSIRPETSARACVRGARALARGARGPRRNHGCARPRRARESAELAKCLLSLREYAACLAQCNRSLALFPDSVALARNRALAFAEGFVLGVETDGRRVVDDAAMSFFEKVIVTPRAANLSIS